MISRTPCGLAAGMNGKFGSGKSGFDLQDEIKLAKRPVALGAVIVNFKDFLYTWCYGKSQIVPTDIQLAI